VWNYFHPTTQTLISSLQMHYIRYNFLFIFFAACIPELVISSRCPRCLLLIRFCYSSFYWVHKYGNRLSNLDYLHLKYVLLAPHFLDHQRYQQINVMICRYLWSVVCFGHRSEILFPNLSHLAQLEGTSTPILLMPSLGTLLRLK
jgi:hypothetical protein